MSTIKNERLEELSDKVRRGEPISFTEALEVVEYQEKLRKVKKKSFIQKIFKCF